MLETLKYKKLTWVDLETPTADEVKTLVDKYSLHPSVAEELLEPTLRPRVDFYPGHIYLILHFPVFDSKKMEYVSSEVDFVLGKNFLITAHYRTIPTLNEMVKVLEADAILKADSLIGDTGALFFFILMQLYSFTQKQLDHLQLNIDDISERMFEKRNNYDDLIRRISHRRKDTLDFRRALQLHREIFNSLNKPSDILGKDFGRYLNNISGEFMRIWQIAENQRETIASIQETTDSLLNHRSNEIMKVLSVMAFVTFPLILTSSIFGMNAVASMPFVGKKGDFWIVIGIMIISTSIMYAFFKRKKWF